MSEPSSPEGPFRPALLEIKAPPKGDSDDGPHTPSSGLIAKVLPALAGLISDPANPTRDLWLRRLFAARARVEMSFRGSTGLEEVEALAERIEAFVEGREPVPDINDLELAWQALAKGLDDQTRRWLDDDGPGALLSRLAAHASADLLQLVVTPQRPTAYALLAQLVFDLGQLQGTCREARAGPGEQPQWRPGPLEAHLARTEPGCVLDSQRDPEKLAAAAAALALARLAGADCCMVYYWDRRLHRPVALATRGLRFPQTVVGAWGPRLLTRNFMLGPAEPVEVVDEPRLTDDAHANMRAFKERERLATLYAVPVRSEHARLVVYLGWRRAAAPDHRDFRPAARYLQGWMSGHDIDVAGMSLLPLASSAQEIVADIGKILGARFQEAAKDPVDELARIAAAAVRKAVSLKNFAVGVHRIRWENDRRWLEFHVRSGEKLPEGTALRQPIDAELGADGLLPDRPGLSPQAARWNAPILMTGIPGESEVPADLPEDTRGLLARRLPIRRSDWQTRCELVLPFGSKSDRLAGVVNIEASSHHAITAEQVLRVELIARMVTRMIAFASSADASDVEWLDALLNDERNLPADLDALLGGLCDRVHQIRNADFVFAVAHDGTSDTFRPRALWIDNAIRRTLLSSRVESDHGSEDLLRLLPQHGPVNKALAKLCDYSIRVAATPRPRGRTHEAFVSRKARYFDLANLPARTRPAALLCDHFAQAWVLPISASPMDPPEAVLWLAWREWDAARHIRLDRLDVQDPRLSALCGIGAAMASLYKLEELAR